MIANRRLKLSTLNFNVAGIAGDDQPVLIADNPPGGTTLETHFEGVPGHPPNRFVATVPGTITGGAWLTYAHGQKRFRVILPPGDGPYEAGLPPCLPPEYNNDSEKVALIYSEAVTSLPQLQCVDRYFRKENNRFFLNGATGFAAYQRYVFEGDQTIRPVLQQRQALGFNSVRVATAYDIPNIGRLVPREIHDYYPRLEGFISLCAEYGQYPYISCYFGANQAVLGNQQEMVTHQVHLEEVLEKVGFGLLDLHNEFDHPLNSPSHFIGPNPRASVMWSQGSGQQDVDPPTPLGRFYARHPGSSEFQRKVGKQNIDFALGNNIFIPGVDDETVRMDATSAISWRQMFDAGAMGAFFCAGAFYHSAQAKMFQPWSGIELDRAGAWCQGVRSIPLDIAQEGQYFHREGQEGGDILRVYEKVLGNRSKLLVIAKS